MANDGVQDKIVDIVADHLGISESLALMTSKLIDDLGADSLNIVEIIIDVEDEFDVSISDEEAMTIKTVADLVDLVGKKKS